MENNDPTYDWTGGAHSAPILVINDFVKSLTLTNANQCAEHVKAYSCYSWKWLDPLRNFQQTPATYPRYPKIQISEICKKGLGYVPGICWSFPRDPQNNPAILIHIWLDDGAFCDPLFLGHLILTHSHIDYPKDHWTLKTGVILRTLPLLYRFFHPSIGGSKIQRVQAGLLGMTDKHYYPKK